MPIRLENLENLEPPGLSESAQGELEDLASQLEVAGIDAYAAPLGQSYSARLQESAEAVTSDVLNIVLDAAVEVALVGAIEEVVGRWARRRRRFRGSAGARPVAVIWGPDGRPLKEVTLPEPEEETIGGGGVALP